MDKPKLIALFSGGIDSPVACALMARRFRILPVHFVTVPYAPRESLERTAESLERLSSICVVEKVILVPWSPFLDKVLGQEHYRKYTCLLCKRGMLKVAELICEEEEAFGILTGEALAQKASQTLANLVALSHGIRFPILRPLLGMDKSEIERLSKKFGIWSPSHAGGCRAVPSFPKTKANPNELEEIFLELQLDKEIKSLHKKRVETRPEEISQAIKLLSSDFLNSHTITDA
jgi:thiamine biosynthesis protein ThiI